jgi:hypothetical protein
MNPSWIHYITICLLYLPVFPSVYFPHQLFTKKEIPIHLNYVYWALNPYFTSKRIANLQVWPHLLSSSKSWWI